MQSLALDDDCDADELAFLSYVSHSLSDLVCRSRLIVRYFALAALSPASINAFVYHFDCHFQQFNCRFAFFMSFCFEFRKAGLECVQVL